MSAESAAVLHVTAAAGGGADRYIRDLAANTARRHFALHVGADIDVLEDIRARRFVPLRDVSGAAGDRAAMARWLRAAGAGLVHLHSMDEGCRGRLRAILEAGALPYFATLHDVQFVNPRAFEFAHAPEPEPEWIAGLAPVLEGAATVIAPSAFIGDLARRCVPRIGLAVIAPGIRLADPSPPPPTPADFAAQAPRHTVAVVGAVGPHKGSGVLDALAAALAGSGVGLVVIGYTDTRLARGWRVPGRLYVHGPYVDGALAGWLAAYGAEAALFPNRLPESFSYTLSEVWASGLPVIVPDAGALGERVARHGGGWRLPEGFDGAAAATLLARLFSAEGAAERGRVKSRIAPGDPQRIPTLEAMSRDIDALYERYAPAFRGTADADAAREALAPLLAVNLDGFVFRKELVNLAGELEQANARLAEAQAWATKLERDHAATVEWAAKLERDSAAWAAKLERDSAAWAARLEADIHGLKQEVERLNEENRGLREHKAAFDLLPESVGKWLLKRASRAPR